MLKVCESHYLKYFFFYNTRLKCCHDLTTKSHLDMKFQQETYGP